MNIIAYAFIALGYTIMYWGANNIKHWDRSVQTTEAAPLSLLFGFPANKDTVPIHPIPFPYTSPNASAAPPASGGTTPPKAGPGSQFPRNQLPSNLSPNYPGAPGSTIPTPPVGGGSV